MKELLGAQWLSGRVLDSRPKGRRFEPHRRHCIVVLEQHIYPSLVLVQPRKTRPYITERLLMGCKESNETNKMKELCALRGNFGPLWSSKLKVVFHQSHPIHLLEE